MCHTCDYGRRLHQEQYACFKCRCVKNISRKRRQSKLFYFLADGVPYAYEKEYAPRSSGTPKCSECAQTMQWVGPHFRAPKKKRVREWEKARVLQWVGSRLVEVQHL